MAAGTCDKGYTSHGGQEGPGGEEREGEVGRGQRRYSSRGHIPSDLPPPARPHQLKFPEPLKIGA
jgi:hypothetical protein